MVKICRRAGFTLVEVLTVIGILTVLVAIIFPVVSRVHERGVQARCIFNLRHPTTALQIYAADYGAYPLMSSPPTEAPVTTWADRVYHYTKNTDLFICPSFPERLATPLHDNPRFVYGGFEFNYQYLGNGRFPWAATEEHVTHPAQTVLVADTEGCGFDAGVRRAGTYVIDPPLTTARGARPTTPGQGFYGAGAECVGARGCRAVPAERHLGRISVGFADGHVKSMTLRQLDDFNGDGRPDNGWFNGRADPTIR